MARQRGGGNKRQATTPVGASYKDPRRDARAAAQQARRFDAMGDYDTSDGEWTEVTHGRSNNNSNNADKSPEARRHSSHEQEVQQTHHEHQINQPESNQRGQEPQSFASVVAQGTDATASSSQDARHGEREKKKLARMFKTAPPDGPLRDNIIVEIRKVNGVPFKGSLHFKEAKFGIFEGCMKQDPSMIHGLSFAFSDYPIVKFKLKHQINIDSLKPMEFFEFNRSYRVNGMQKSDVLQCKIKGIRENYSDQAEQGDSDPDVRWVKIEWCDYSMEENEILAWLELFGEPISHLTEEIYPDSDSDADPTGNGTFTIKMKLHSPIPQLLPMWGKRIRVYYRGIQKLCSRCFGNHPRRNCRSEKRRWVDYVLDFMERYQDIPAEIYGKWLKVVNEEFGEIVVTHDDNAVSEVIADQANMPSQGEPEPTESLSRDTRAPQNRGLQRQIQLKPAFVSSRPAKSSATSASHTQNVNRNERSITAEEEDNLADFLAVGMSLTEARDLFQKQVELSEIKQRAREIKRNTQRGDIVQRGSYTRIGPTGSQRGGLSFN